MDRREVLALAGGGLAAALAGCSGDASDEQEPTPEPGTGENGSDDATGTDDAAGTDDGTETGTEPDDGDGNTDDSSEVGDGGVEADIPGEPLSTVEAYVAAVDSADEKAALALLHEDSEQEPSDVSRDLEFFSGAEVVLVAHGIVKYDDPDVVARGIIEVTREEEGSSRVGLELTLRQAADDRWLIVDGRATRLDDSGGDGSASLGGTET
jgi:hypothetical protein